MTKVAEDAMEALPKILSEHERSMEGRGASSLAFETDFVGSGDE